MPSKPISQALPHSAWEFPAPCDLPMVPVFPVNIFGLIAFLPDLLPKRNRETEKR